MASTQYLIYSSAVADSTNGHNMILPFAKQIWFYPRVIDFRKQLNSLMMLVVNQLGRDPGSGELFIFRDRTGKKLKMIYLDGLSFWLLACRLEQGRLNS